jgi:UDP-N-acetylmuramyl pentapeptide phosphotransferase/UDP-N-acetylglucosamine-1-phosphate transferase
VPTALVPSSVTTLLYDTATAAMKDTALSALVLGVALAIIAWLAGPFRAPSRLRALYNDGIAGVRRNAEQHGVTTGRVGGWVYAQRRVLHVIIALAAAAAVILLRPLSGEAIAWILILTVVVLVVLSLVERPAVEAGTERQGEPLPAPS